MLLRISFLLLLLSLAWRFIPKRSYVTRRLQEEYDYVIVGGGAAGSVVAARLSENSNLQIAMLEAGPDDDEFPETDLPINYFNLQTTDVDWAYLTVPQKHACAGLIERQGAAGDTFSDKGYRRSAWPRGRGLGGSTLINGLMVTRGSRHDYDRWAAMGNDGWGYQDMLPYLKKLERVTNPQHLKSGYRGSDGPLTVSEPIPLPALTDAFLKGLESMGHPIRDCNGEDMIGAMPFQGHIRNGVRDSTSKAYLKPVMSRPNLHVAVEAHVMKVLFEGSRAVVVEYLDRGYVRRVYARREVILSAGAVATPQLLMLSGVGPMEHLDEFNIPVVADLPVGEHLQDHLMTEAVVYTMDQPVTMHPSDINLYTKLQYQLFGTGPIAGPGRAGTAFFKSVHQDPDAGNPHLQMIFDGLLLGTDPEGRKMIARSYNQDLKVFDAVHAGEAYKYGASMFVKLLQPLSVGDIKLKSTNPFDHPLIDPQYLSHQRDVDILVEGIRKSQRLLETEPFRKLGSRRQVNLHPNCTDHEYDTDQYWECYVRSNTLTVYHPVSTCRMGPDGDPTAVVDAQLRVRGVDGLRVVDASVMPDITSGNTLIPVLAIAERASDIILGKAPSV